MIFQYFIWSNCCKRSTIEHSNFTR